MANSNPIQSNGTNNNGAALNWNGTLTEASIQATSGTYQNYGKISFPVMEITASFSQDLVEHKRPNVAGARVESMGSNPIIFKIKAPFLFGLQRGNGETWDNLFPASFFQVVQILNDQVAPIITFVHSTLGTFNVKPKSASTVTDAHIRNGQILEFELVSADEDNSQTNVTTQIEFGLAQSSATLFDQQVSVFVDSLPADASIPNDVADFADGTDSVADILGNVSSALSTTTLFINNVAAVVNNAVFQINSLSTSLDSMDNPSVAPLQMQLQRCISGIYSQINNQALPQTPSAATQLASAELSQALQTQQQLNILNGSSNLGVFVVNADMTLGNVALLVHNTADQIITLNPALSKVPTILVGTQVVFYGAAPQPAANALVAITTQVA